MKTVIAGPWIGEFGWELFCWQGFLRRYAKQFDRTIVVCRTGHDVLYDDFAHTIMHFDPLYEETDMWHNRKGPRRKAEDLFTFGDHHGELTFVRGDRYTARWWATRSGNVPDGHGGWKTEHVQGEHWSLRQDLRKLGSGYNMQLGFTVLMIVRNTHKCDTGFRNWPRTHATDFANSMVARGHTVACVGKSESSAHIAGTVDLRDIPLVELADVMRNSKVIVGPQCGPTHFATLCELPQVCWQTCKEHARRVSVAWNPYETQVETLCAGNDSYWKNRNLWVPTLDYTIERTLSVIEGDIHNGRE
jgi:hypothetical protein